MGFFDTTIFSKKLRESGDPKSTVIDPLAAQKTTAAGSLVDALQTPEITARPILDLTSAEQISQGRLESFAGDTAPQRTTALNTLTGMLGQPTDITELPEFRAILDAINLDRDEAVNQGIQRTQLGGVRTGTAGAQTVGRELARGRTRQVAALAPFAESERNRRFQIPDMISRLLSAGDQAELSRFGAVDAFGRNIEQERSDEAFRAELSRIMFPSTTGANVASRILGGSVDTAVQPGDPSILAQLAPLIGIIGKAAAGGAGAAAA